MKKTDRVDTQARILDVAEEHFGRYGYEGTTLRGIIKDADVNVAAVAYHFGSKDSLLLAVIQRFASPVVEQQIERLRFVMKVPDCDLNDVLRAFYEPPLVLIKNRGEKGETLSMFLGRFQTEPEPVFSLVDRNYASCRNEFIAAFRVVCPGLSDADYHWNFEFMLSLILCFLTRQTFIRQRYGDTADWQIDEIVDRLIAFAGPGMMRNSAPPRSSNT